MASFHRLTRSVLAIFAGLLLLCPAPASAGPIDPGFDLFVTEPGTFVMLPTPGGLVRVDLRGLPIGPGNSDTIVRRIAGSSPGFDFGRPPETIPIELVGLSLVSVNPIPVGGSFFDVFVTLDPSPPAGRPTVGAMNVDHDHPDGGSFDSQLPVNALIRLVDTSNPAIEVVDSFFDVFFSIDVPWSHTEPQPHSKHNREFPAGGFYAGVIPGTGGAWQPFDENAQLALHRVRPAVPEPGLPALLGIGLAALMWMRRRP